MGVDSAGPIGRAQAGIDFCPRMGDGWAYLEVYTPRSQVSEKDLQNAPVTVRISMVSEGVASKTKMSFRTPIFLVCLDLASRAASRAVWPMYCTGQQGRK